MWTMGTPLRGNPPGTAWNPADKDTGVVLSNANRDATGTASVRAVASASTGKFYFEVYFVSSGGANVPYVGIASGALVLGNRMYASNGAAYEHNGENGVTFTNGTGPTSTGSVPIFAAGDVVGIASDLTNGKTWFSKNGTWINNTAGVAGNPSAGTNERCNQTTAVVYYPAVSAEGWLLRGNFGSGDFAYSAPAGFAPWPA